jgi:hypothetical protein
MVTDMRVWRIICRGVENKQVELIMSDRWFR